MADLRQKTYTFTLPNLYPIFRSPVGCKVQQLLSTDPLMASANMVSLQIETMNKLRSEDQLSLLNAIDRLRSQGISNYVSLPQIIVCGDQSSGKSSVLEAISGVPFPVKSSLCTRFPTELVLRRAAEAGACVSIVPHESRPEEEVRALRSFKEELAGFGDLPGVTEKATQAMGVSKYGKAFSKDILRVEISGPSRPHLTIVDLPGLIHSETKNQSSSDVELIQDVVRGYMGQPRCIILAVVSAKNDVANQIVLKLARSADPSGTRTLGVITKPDRLTPESNSEREFLSLARNQEVELRLGWHVLRNLDSEVEPGTMKERDQKESEFFQQGNWNKLPLSSLGVSTLRDRLSDILLTQIVTELPSVMQEIEAKFQIRQEQLDKLGDPRASLSDQRSYLFRLSQTFQILIKSAVDGTYSHSFFISAKSKTGRQQRIRAAIQNLNEEFASEISANGLHQRIVDDKDDDDDDDEESVAAKENIVTIYRGEFLSHIESLMRDTRGRELPGTFNPMIVTDLFLEQSQPWEGISRRHVERVWNAALRFLDLVTDHIADDSTSKMLQQEIFEPKMKRMLDALNRETTKLLDPHQHGHPITYNTGFSEALKKARRKRFVDEADDIVSDFFDIRKLSRSNELDGKWDLRDLVESLADARVSLNMKRYAAMEALDCLEAYYEVNNLPLPPNTRVTADIPHPRSH